MTVVAYRCPQCGHWKIWYDGAARGMLCRHYIGPTPVEMEPHPVTTSPATTEQENTP